MLDENKVAAREQTALYYLRQMTKSGWTCTHTADKYARYDVTATNGEKVFYAETKIRDYNANKIRDEGSFTDAGKVDYLAGLPHPAAIVHFFPANNEAYVWNIAERDQWPRVQKLCRKTNQTAEKTEKCVCLLPLDERHKRQIDLSDYEIIYNQAYSKLSNAKQNRKLN